jgi:hypothetical protein
MMSLQTFTTLPLPPDTPPLPPLNANTHAGILPASASSNLASLQNGNVGNLIDECFAMLPEIDALGDGKILGERGAADQTNSRPHFPMGLSMTSLPAEVDSTAKGNVLEGPKGGGIFPTSLSSTRHAHNCHINSNKYIFF